ncbi:ABC transporter ATP-binding protein [[Eubacterium] hominis]|uniref:ABC transporter ATP-binding protein n=1 Tax=[Eubacterium] hominis TaxID=2764325 RepID=UPI003A4D5048
MLELKKVTKAYISDKGIFDVTIQFHEGEITGILGRNGSGKTTLLKSILDLIQIDAGEILLDGSHVYDRYQDVAFISEEGSFMPNMTALEYGRFLKDYYKHFDFHDYQALLEQFEISKEGKIKDFSKGQKMKTEIAAGFSMHAKLIVLDEPFNGLDVYAKEDTIKLLIQQLHEDTVILISTHNIEEIETIADRCIVMEKGKIRKDVKMDQLHEVGMDLKDLLDQYRTEIK